MAQLVKTMAGLAIASVKTVNGLAIASVKTVAGLDNTSGGGLVAFSDTFAGNGDISGRALSGGTGTWVEDVGSLDTNTSQLRSVTGSFAKNMCTINTACGSLVQYMLITQPSVSSTVFGAHCLRYVDASSPYYAFEMDLPSGNWSWYTYPNAASSSSTQIGGIINLTHAANDKWGITITGIDASTEVRIWKNPTANTPVSATEWDSGDTTPDGIWTDDPGANACNVGQKMGLQCFSSGTNEPFAAALFAGGLA